METDDNLNFQWSLHMLFFNNADVLNSFFDVTKKQSMYTKGFCQVKKIPKIREKSEVGGWVKPQLIFLFFFKYCVFCVLFFFVVHVSKKNIKNG